MAVLLLQDPSYMESHKKEKKIFRPGIELSWFLHQKISFPVNEIELHPLKRNFPSVQLLSCMRLFATSWTAAREGSVSITTSWSLLKLMSIESVMPSNHLILCRPLRLPPSIFPSIRVFSNESVLHIKWPKYWSFILSISPSSEYSRLIFFRMDWLDLLAIQGTLKSLHQHHNSKASILWCSILDMRRWEIGLIYLLLKTSNSLKAYSAISSFTQNTECLIPELSTLNLQGVLKVSGHNNL